MLMTRLEYVHKRRENLQHSSQKDLVCKVVSTRLSRERERFRLIISEPILNDTPDTELQLLLMDSSGTLDFANVKDQRAFHFLNVMLSKHHSPLSLLEKMNSLVELSGAISRTDREVEE